MGRPQSADHPERRAAVLEAAAELFALHGVRGTSMSMIASAASGSKAWVYHYYPSKAAIVEDLLDGFLEAVVSAAATAVAAGGDAEVRLRRLLVAVVVTCNMTPGGAGLFDLRGASSVSPSVAERRRRFVALLERALVDAEDRLEAHPAVLRPVVQSVLGMLSWQHRWWSEDGPLSLEQWGHLVADMAIGGMAAAVTDARLR